MEGRQRERKQTVAPWSALGLEGMELVLMDKDQRSSQEVVLAKQPAEAARTVGQVPLAPALRGSGTRFVRNCTLNAIPGPPCAG
jgi:hypothetical protein